MKRLTEEQLTLLHEVMSGVLSHEFFLKKNDFDIDIELCFNMLLEAKVENDMSKFRNVLWGLVSQLIYSQKLLLYRMALIDQWHNEHEEIVNAFQIAYNKEPDNIKYIKMALQNIPDYLSNSVLKDSYIRKCFYAIAAQPAPYNCQALRELSTSKDEIIQKYALHQLKKNGFEF